MSRARTDWYDFIDDVEWAQHFCYFVIINDLKMTKYSKQTHHCTDWRRTFLKYSGCIWCKVWQWRKSNLLSKEGTEFPCSEKYPEKLARVKRPGLGRVWICLWVLIWGVRPVKPVENCYIKISNLLIRSWGRVEIYEEIDSILSFGIEIHSIILQKKELVK